MAQLLYDETCGLCRTLAVWIERRSSGQLVALGAQAAEQLCVIEDDGARHEGIAAWQKVLELYPDLRGLHWAASRLGLARETARVLERTATLARRFCWTCRRL